MIFYDINICATQACVSNYHFSNYQIIIVLLIEFIESNQQCTNSDTTILT